MFSILGLPPGKWTWQPQQALGSSAFGPGACITEAIGLLAPKRCAAPHCCHVLAMHNRPTWPLLLGMEPQLPPLVLHQHPSESDPCTSASACLGSAASWVLEYPCVHAWPCWAGVCPQQMRTDRLELGAAAGLLGVLVKDCRHSLAQALKQLLSRLSSPCATEPLRVAQGQGHAACLAWPAAHEAAADMHQGKTQTEAHRAWPLKQSSPHSRPGWP